MWKSKISGKTTLPDSTPYSHLVHNVNYGYTVTCTQGHHTTWQVGSCIPDIASLEYAEVESGRIGLPDVYAICRRHGLEPLQLQHNSQIEALKIMLKTMDMPADNLYPIAVKVGQKFKSLDLEKDVTWALDYKTDAENNIVAISTEGTQYIDGRKTDFSGIVCSTNYSSLRLPPKVIKLGCHTLLKEHATLNDAAIGTVLQVSCPKNCMHNCRSTLWIQS